MKQRLLLIVPAKQRGGAEEYALKLARQAIAADWQVYLACEVSPGTQTLIQDCGKHHIHHIRTTPFEPRKPSKQRRKLINLIQVFSTVRVLLIARPSAVIFNLNWPFLGWPSMILLAGLKISTLSIFHAVPNTPNNSLGSILRKIYRELIFQSQTWIAVSHYSRQRLTDIFGVPEEPIQMIHNGIRCANPSENQRLKARQDLVKALHLSDTSTLIVTVARLEISKGYKELLWVAHQLSQTHSDVKFIWVGDGKLSPFLQQEVQRLQLTNTIYLLGYRTDVEALLTAADVFILPSHFESFPLVMLEAAAVKVPMILSAVGGIPEFIHHGKNGWLCPPNDPHCLLKALQDVLAVPSQAQAMATQAHQDVQKLSEASQLEKVIDVIHFNRIKGRS